MKILLATEKPFAAAAVEGIRNIVERAGHELALLEKYSDKSQLLEAVADADAMYDFLISRGIIVRNRNRVKGCEGCLRITIGKPEENEALLISISEYEKSVVR